MEKAFQAILVLQRPSHFVLEEYGRQVKTEANPRARCQTERRAQSYQVRTEEKNKGETAAQRDQRVQVVDLLTCKYPATH